MSDYKVGDTIYHHFSTRAFATGIPTTLIGTPVAEAYEEASDTGMTAGVSLTIDHAETGHHLLTIVATGGNSFETGKSYGVSLTAGTVDSVSVVGEVIFNFTLEKSPAAQDTAAVKIATDKMVFTVANQLDTNPLSWNSVLLATTNPLPNAAAEAAGGLYTRGSGAGQVNQNANGIIDVNAVRLGGNTSAVTNLTRWMVAAVSGTADSGTTTTMVDTGRTESSNIFSGSLLVFSSGPLFRQYGLITDFDPGSDIFTFTPAVTTDVTTENYVIIPVGRANVDAWLGTAVSALNDISASDVWSAATRVLTAGTNLNDVSVADILTTQMAEAYAANGTAPTLAQALFALHQMLMDFSISGTSVTVEKLDGTTAFTVTLDDGTNPTSANRA